jgi:hypothetical protein
VNSPVQATGPACGLLPLRPRDKRRKPDNTGKIVVPAGTVYGPYAEALLKTDYLVEGIIGTLP